MMKNMLAAAGSAALIALLPGCTHTRINDQQASPEERAWEDIIRDNYPGYRPPPTTSRSFQGHTEKRSSSAIRTPLKPAEDPADPDLKANEAQSDDLPAGKPAEPAVSEVKTDAPAEKPAESAVSEGKTDAPAEKPAEPAAAEVKTDAPAEKPAEPAAAEVKTDAPVTVKGAVAPPDPTNSTVYEVKSGDTLGSISRKAYGDARYGNVIFKANTDILKDPNKLRPGMKLIVPKL